MDYSKFIESFSGVACVVSLRQKADSEGNVITIAAANRKYLASVNKLDEEFVPNRPYNYYIADDPNFVALVNGCVADGKICHQYVNAERYKAWLDLYMIPLEEDEEGNRYCLFSYEMTKNSDSDKLIEISEKTAYMVLKTCIKFRENTGFKETLDSIVKDIRLQCESDGCAIILTDPIFHRIDMLCFDSEGGFAPPEDDVFFKDEFYEIVKKWHNVLAGSNCIIISSEQELKAIEKKDKGWYDSLVMSGVKSLVLYPLRVGENFYGYIFASNFNPDKTVFIREVMELNSYILSAEVENYRMRQALENLSRTDMLTGVLNSNAMNGRVKRLASGEEKPAIGIGVIFVDVNGLKKVNDTNGHAAGDDMLRKVANKLMNVCGDRELYRAGGDEFLIIADTGREQFEKLCENLKSQSRVEGEPSFSVGACYGEDGTDIKAVMKKADTEMYANKADFYRCNPGLDRRTH